MANAHEVIGSTRRDFLKAAAAAPALGAFYFGYQTLGDKPPVRAAIIGTGNEGCGAMIHDHNRAYVDFIGFCDIRPSQQERAVKEFSKHKDYSPADVAKLRKYDDVDEMLDDKDVEMVVIALPLWLHAPVAIKAMKAGKHVFCEKLMAHNITQCKEMVKVARETNQLLAIGHQRHYSALYDNANYLVQEGHLGEIRHIRACWHRNNAVPQIEKDSDGKLVYDDKGNPVYKKDKAGNVLYYDGWKPPIPAADEKVDFAKYGYKSLDELVRWRLYNRTGAGLMAELGSHQLDACSIFLGKKHPLAVTGIGGTFFYTDGREVDDHVFVNFEFPGKAEKDHVVVTYSSINTNRFDEYGEELMGSRGPCSSIARRRSCSTRSRTPTPPSRPAAEVDQRDRRDQRQGQAGRRGQPERRRAVGGHQPGGPGHGRPVARATARSWSTSPTASATATPRTSTTSPTRTSPAAGARSPWPTPSSP